MCLFAWFYMQIAIWPFLYHVRHMIVNTQIKNSTHLKHLTTSFKVKLFFTNKNIVVCSLIICIDLF